MGLFGPSKAEVWQEFAQSIGGRYIEGGFLSGGRVESDYKSWTIYLDTYTVSTGKSSTTYTRIRMPFVNLIDFDFKIYRTGVFSDFGKAFGMQDIEIGDARFDEKFVIKGADEMMIKRLFADELLKSCFMQQDKLKIEIKQSEGVLSSKIINGESEVYFMVVGVIKDVYKLQSLFKLFEQLIEAFLNLSITTTQKPSSKLFKSE